MILNKLKTKVKAYLSLKYEFKRLRKNIETQIEEKNSLTFLKFQNQDRFRLMEILKKDRETKKFKDAFEKKSPLVSVRIATYNNSHELLERAIPSVINQTYKNWEIVIVGDYCTDDTEEKIKKLNHPRIRFEQLTYHYPYPDNQLQRWMAQGALVHNRAVELCKGDWIAPLDDDNEFLPNHIEMLLEKAQNQKLELVYGNMISIDRETNETTRVGRFPPQVGTFDFSACLYHQALKIFPYDISSYHLGEVIDTNLIRRLREAEVKMGFVNRYVTRYFFRKPGSKRTHLELPNQPGVYSIYQDLNITTEQLSYSLADQAYEVILNSRGKIVITGNKNLSLTKFVSEACKKKKVKLEKVTIHKKTAVNKNIDTLIINTNDSRKITTFNKFRKNLKSGSLIIFLSSIKNKRLRFGKEEYQLLEPNILNKL